MRLYFDDELNILRDIHDLNCSECLILSDNEGTENYLYSTTIIDNIISDSGLEKWKDNSKSQFPPDLINKDDSLIMEVMRVDDHSPNGKINPVLAKQRKMAEEARPFLELCPQQTRFIANAVTGLPTDEDHNYKFYYTSFNRTIKKHLDKLETYRRNHPNNKVIFLVFDETSGIYFEKIRLENNNILGTPHIPFFDVRFLNAFIDSDLDYLMWYIPYNHYKSFGGHITFPRLILIDIKNARNGVMLKRIKYDEKKMVSSEQ